MSDNSENQQVDIVLMAEEEKSQRQVPKENLARFSVLIIIVIIIIVLLVFVILYVRRYYIESL